MAVDILYDYGLFVKMSKTLMFNNGTEKDSGFRVWNNVAWLVW